MTATMADRGPDGVGTWSAGPVALGHRRLKLIDLSDAAQQPRIDAQLGLTVTYNGCIYNYPQLREKLKRLGHRFFSGGDTEVLLKGYAQWGSDVVDHLLGMFAFVIVEQDGGRVVMARDRLGVKPLYVAEVTGAVRWASTLPALLAGGGIDTSLDPVVPAPTARSRWPSSVGDWRPTPETPRWSRITSSRATPPRCPPSMDFAARSALV